jgi:hypothetical protein
MANPDFVMAVPPGGGEKRLVPVHYLENPALGFKLPPSARAQEPAENSDATTVVREPAAADSTGEQVEEPAAATPKTIKRTGAAGKDKEVSA